MIRLYTCIDKNALNFYREKGLNGYGVNGFLMDIDGERKRCIKTYFHPDDHPYAGNKDYMAISFTVDMEKCYVAEGAYYLPDPEAPAVLSVYYSESVVPIKEYQITSYKRPECIVIKRDDEFIRIETEEEFYPTVYDAGEFMYNQSKNREMTETYPEFIEKALYFYCMYLVHIQQAKRIDYYKWEYILFIVNKGNRKILIKKKGEA